MPALLREFITWVNAQPPRRRYNFWNTKKCALAQFAKAHFATPYVDAGVDSITVGQTVVDSEMIWLDIPRGKVATYGDALIHSKTFGQLAKRLRPLEETVND